MRIGVSNCLTIPYVIHFYSLLLVADKVYLYRILTFFIFIFFIFQQNHSSCIFFSFSLPPPICYTCAIIYINMYSPFLLQYVSHEVVLSRIGKRKRQRTLFMTFPSGSTLYHLATQFGTELNQWN